MLFRIKFERHFPLILFHVTDIVASKSTNRFNYHELAETYSRKTLETYVHGNFDV